MMLRLLNIAALSVLVGTAGWAYQTKYETIRYAEAVKKLEIKTEKERDMIAILKAEWQLLNRPARLEGLAAKLDMRPLKATQIGPAKDLPARGKDVDQIGQKLDSLLTGSISTPNPGRSADKTPVKKTVSAKPAKSKVPLAKVALGRSPQAKAAAGKTAPVKTAATKTTPIKSAPLKITPPTPKVPVKR